MQRLTYAFRFMRACFSLAIKYPRLRKPWFHLWMGGFGVLLIWLIPLGLVTALIGFKPLGLFLMGLFIILLLFCLIAWGALTALETSLVFDDLIWMEKQLPGSSGQKREFGRWQDILLWLLTLPGFEIIRLFNQAFRPAHTSKSDWLTASYLMLPVIALEDFSLREGIDRIKQLVSDRLLRFHPALVAVCPVTGVFQWVFILGGWLLGLWVGLMIADPLTAGLLSRLIALVAGMMLSGVLALLGIHFSSFNRVCYYTTLYQWALNVENARMTGDGSQSAPPAILSQVMKINKPSKKEK